MRIPDHLRILGRTHEAGPHHARTWGFLGTRLGDPGTRARDIPGWPGDPDAHLTRTNPPISSNTPISAYIRHYPPIPTPPLIHIQIAKRGERGGGKNDIFPEIDSDFGPQGRFGLASGVVLGVPPKCTPKMGVLGSFWGCLN